MDNMQIICASSNTKKEHGHGTAFDSVELTSFSYNV